LLLLSNSLIWYICTATDVRLWYGGVDTTLYISVVIYDAYIFLIFIAFFAFVLHSILRYLCLLCCFS